MTNDGLAAFDRLMKETVEMQEAIEDVWMKSGGTTAREDTYAAFERLIAIARQTFHARADDERDLVLLANRAHDAEARAEAAERLNGELLPILKAYIKVGEALRPGPAVTSSLERARALLARIESASTPEEEPTDD